MTAQLTPQALEAIAASDEYTAPIFRGLPVGGCGETKAALRRLLAAFPKGNEKEHDEDCMCVYHEAVKALVATGEPS